MRGALLSFIHGSRSLGATPLREALKRLKKGSSLVVFPEGKEEAELNREKEHVPQNPSTARRSELTVEEICVPVIPERFVFCSNFAFDASALGSDDFGGRDGRDVAQVEVDDFSGFCHGTFL